MGCGANVNSLQNNGRTALHLCAEAGFKEGIDILLKCKDVEIDLPDKKGKQTPLYLAVAKSGSVPIVTALLQHGAKLDRICFKKTIQEHINEKMPGLFLARFNVNILVFKSSFVLYLMSPLG